MERKSIELIVRESGHTYETLSEEIGVTPQAICEIVKGRTRGATARYALARALNRRPDDLWPRAAA